MKNIVRQCTTLKQSKKLIELGFTKDSASLMWRDFIDKRIFRDKPLWMICFDYDMQPEDMYPILPCWTIVDMMNLIKSCEKFKYYDIDDFERVAIENTETFKYFNTYDNLKDNLFDCLVWLKENKYL